MEERASTRAVEHLAVGLIFFVGVFVTFAILLVSGRTAAPLGWPVGFLVGIFVTLAFAFVRAARRLRRVRGRDVRHREDLEVLVGAATLLEEESRRDRVGDLTARLAAAVLDGEAAVACLRREGGGLTVTGSFTIGAELPEISHADPAVGEVLRTGRVVTAHDGAARHLVLVPLVTTSGVLGLAVVAVEESRSVDEFTLHLAQLFGSHAGHALERLEAMAQLTTLVVKDPLTGVGNRRHASLMLERLSPGDAIMLIDLDRFKQINDSYGHTFGDEVLCRLGRYLRESLRGGDEVSRYGGEEFLVVLHGVGAGAAAAAGRLIDGWRASGPPTTFSLGYATLSDDETVNQCFARADAALYRAKNAGRDRAMGTEAGSPARAG